MTAPARIGLLEGSVKDLRIISEGHGVKLERHETRLDEHGGYLATLDRLLEKQERELLAKIDVISLTVKAQFRDMREELRRAQNGR